MKTLKNLLQAGLLTFAIILLSITTNSAYAQSGIVVDGDNCRASSNEWPTTANAVDIDDVGSITSSSNIRRVWAANYLDTLYFAFTRASDGGAGFALHFNTDCNISTGDVSKGGAEIALYFTTNSNVIGGLQGYKWTSASGGSYTPISNSFNVALGDSTCANFSYNFIELKVAMNQLVNVCALNSCGGVSLSHITSYSGTSFNSTIKDRISLSIFHYINDVPNAAVSFSPIACSGDTFILDASASTFNNAGYNAMDSMKSYEWDLDYNGTFSADRTGSSIKEVNIQLAGSSSSTIALIVTDAFNCKDTIDNINITTYALPSLIGTVIVDTAGITQCKNFVWNYTIISSADYKGDPINQFNWTFPDASTDTGSAPSKVFSQCFWNLAGDLNTTVIGTDANGCSSTNTISKPLPVSLVYFKAIKNKSSVRLEWQTASELNADYFILERSLDGRNFNQIAEVSANGNSNVLIDYSHTDLLAPMQVLYYRLKQFDFNGDMEIFDPIRVDMSENQEIFTASPNPANGSITVILPPSIGAGNVAIINAQGQVVMSAPIDGYLAINTQDLECGLYYFQLTSDRIIQNKLIRIIH